VVPRPALCRLIAPFYPKPGNGRSPIGVERMLRIYFLQQWFNLSEPGVEEALYDSLAVERFVGIDLGRVRFTQIYQQCFCRRPAHCMRALLVNAAREG
jgi:hypothetical protein